MDRLGLHLQDAHDRRGGLTSVKSAAVGPHAGSRTMSAGTCRCPERHPGLRAGHLQRMDGHHG